MKRPLSLLLVLLLTLSGCANRSKEDTATGQDAETIARVMLTNLDENEETDFLTWYQESSDVYRYIKDYYKLDDVSLLDGAVVRMEGARAFELAVLQINGQDGDVVSEALQNYLLNRKGAFVGYLPDQAELVDQGLVLSKGEWLALIICQDPEAAKDAFESCFGRGVNAQGVPDCSTSEPEVNIPDGRRLFVDPGKDDMTLFDNSAILAAWENGEDSTLSEADKLVLEAAKAVLAKCVTSDMSSYDKELSLYVWLIQHVEYDKSHYDPQGSPRTSYEPYGPLIDGKGVCLGYASTFQLLMDMAEIECITVTGGAFSSRENHAWNMVRLNGEWYCVDSTWDHGVLYDSTGKFRYFNVTSNYMAQTDHQWDYASVPEATAEDYGRP